MAKSSAFSLIISSFTQLLRDKFSLVSVCENKLIFRPFIQQIYFKISQSSTSSHALNKWWNAKALQKCRMRKARRWAVKQHIFQFCCAECRRNWIFFFSLPHELDLCGDEEGLLSTRLRLVCLFGSLVKMSCRILNQIQNTSQPHSAAEQNPPWKSLNLVVLPSLWLNQECNPKTFSHCNPPPL